MGNQQTTPAGYSCKQCGAAIDAGQPDGGIDERLCLRCWAGEGSVNQMAPAKPTSEEIHDWIDRAYRQPEGVGPMQNDGFRFTRWNMEVAFAAGFKLARRRAAGEPDAD